MAHPDMLAFLSAFIPDVNAKPLVWNGTASLKKRTVDPDAAFAWHRNAERFVDWESCEVFLFGEKRVKLLPVAKPEFIDGAEVEDCSERFNQVVRTLSKGGIVSDEFFQILSRLLEYYAPVQVTKGSDAFSCFRKVKDHEGAFRAAIPVMVDDEEVATIDPHLVIPELEPDEFRFANVMLLVKEVQEGYVSFRQHSIVNQQGEYLQEQKYKIGQDIVIKVLNRRVLSVDAKETEHSIEKVDGSWLIDGKFKTEDFKYVEYDREADGTETYVIKGAYTHVLRKVLGFEPQTWQYRFLVSNKRLNAIAWVRRGGKTILSSYLILRELYRNPSTRKHAMRQRKVLYLAPSEDKFKAVLDYLEASSERIRLLKVLKYSPVDKRYRLFDETLWRNRKKVQTTVATCDFASGKGYEPGRGNWSDFVIIDEAGYVPKDVYLTLLPIIENENAHLFAISTIDWETPKQWFYELLLDYEQGNDPEGYAMRVTIDDIDDTIISPASKERMKAALRDDPNRYYAELYATFPNMSNVFDAGSFFVTSPKVDAVEYVIGYDPAKRSDFAGIIVGAIQGDGKMCLVKEDTLQGDYSAQRDYLMDLKRSYQEKGRKCVVTIDATMVGDVVADTFGSLIDYRVWYSSGNKGRPEMDKWGTWKYSKKDLVHTAQAMMQERMVYADSSLSGLMSEMKNFKAYQTPAGGLRYEASIWHDDLVNAMMLACFYFGHVSWQFHRIAYDTERTLRLFRGTQAEKDNLYASTTKRMPWQPPRPPKSYRF